MDRPILNAVPIGWLFAIMVVIAAVVGVGGFLLMRRFVPSLAENAEQRTLSSAFSITASLFAFVLAFTIGQLYTNYVHAKQDDKTEANAVSQLLRIADGLPPRLGTEVKSETLVYASDVHNREWALMRTGRSDSHAWGDLDSIYATLEAARRAEVGDPFYSQTVSQLNALVAARQARLDDINLSIPTVFKILLLFGALLAIYGTFYFKPFGEPLQVVMIGCAAALIAIGLLVAIELDYPYSGSVSISSAPFSASELRALSAGA